MWLCIRISITWLEVIEEIFGLMAGLDSLYKSSLDAKKIGDSN